MRKTGKHKAVRDFILSISVVATIFYLILSNTVLPVDNVLADTFVVTCTIDTSGDSWDGYLAFGLMEYNPEWVTSMTNSYLVLMNTSGDMVFYRKSDPGWNYLVVKRMAEDTLMYQGDPQPTKSLTSKAFLFTTMSNIIQSQRLSLRLEITVAMSTAQTYSLTRS